MSSHSQWARRDRDRVHCMSASSEMNEELRLFARLTMASTLPPGGVTAQGRPSSSEQRRWKAASDEAKKQRTTRRRGTNVRREVIVMIFPCSQPRLYSNFSAWANSTFRMIHTNEIHNAAAKQVTSLFFHIPRSKFVTFLGANSIFSE